MQRKGPPNLNKKLNGVKPKFLRILIITFRILHSHFHPIINGPTTQQLLSRQFTLDQWLKNQQHKLDVVYVIIVGDLFQFDCEKLRYVVSGELEDVAHDVLV